MDNSVHVIKRMKNNFGKMARVAWLCCVLAMLAASNAAAKDKTAKETKSSPERNATTEAKAGGKAQFAFSEQERQTIHTCVQGYGHGKRSKGLPPGLSKKVARGRQLPPGWQKKCTPGEIMPMAVYEQCHPLPPEIQVKLPPTPEPTLTVTIGGKVVRLLKATREILDVFDVSVKF
jgi:hypothetical protein